MGGKRDSAGAPPTGGSISGVGKTSGMMPAGARAFAPYPGRHGSRPGAAPDSRSDTVRRAMATFRRSRVLQASPDAVFDEACDPHHLPRWWPRVSRVEGVDEHGFTQVLRTRKGRGVRADFRVEDADRARGCRWVQELEGTPCERVFSAATTAIRLQPREDGATQVTLEATRKLRGLNRLGTFMLRPATRRQLDEALDNLAALYER
jgi:uncharacterized protein YndB with AHSA1/START domain